MAGDRVAGVVAGEFGRDPATGEPIGETEDNFKASIAGETYEYTQMYPGFAKTARDLTSLGLIRAAVGGSLTSNILYVITKRPHNMWGRSVSEWQRKICYY